MRIRVEQFVTPLHRRAINFKNGPAAMPCKWGLYQEGRTKTIGEQMAYDYGTASRWCRGARLTGHLAVPVELAVFSIFQAPVCYGLANSLFF